LKIVLINPPHTAIGSRIPDDHLPPLGLLCVGGSLLDRGHQVQLIDAEFGPMPLTAIADKVREASPDAVFFGHSGSTSAHPTVCEIARLVRASLPAAKIVYGGVFPTYHWREILTAEPAVDVIVRGEGEETIRQLVLALESGIPLGEVEGIAYRNHGAPMATKAAAMIRDLDDYRVGWELIDFSRYSYWGGKRAVVVQFSRGCPHLCTYCGQRGFWTRFRTRDPRKFAAELAWLHREHGVEMINFADENPTASRKAWREFLEALIAERVPLILVGSTRAGDIVRDADMLHLYKQAGWERFLMGMESTDSATLAKIRKGATTSTDREAIVLLRQHDILSMATWVIGFEEETDADYLRGLRQLISYDPDQIQMIYVTPHRWTPYFVEASNRRVIQADQRRWDYKHQVLATRHVPPWRVFLWFKAMELILQIRPRAILRLLFHPDRSIRRAIRWYYRMGRRVWFFEVRNWLFRDTRLRNGPTLREFWGEQQVTEQEPLRIERRSKRMLDNVAG
jgi:anaerobic magnesium-protoporphyrin IX monomethyl ester cyclase